MLWSRFLQGDPDAFGSLIHLHYDELFHYARQFTKDHALVKDCIQELFILLWKNRDSISETSYVKFYLFKSLRRSLAKEIKKKNTTSLEEEFAFEGFMQTELSHESKMIIEENLLELTERVRSELAKLPRRQQELIYLRFYQGASLEEAADIMALNRQSVYNLLHESLKRLKNSGNLAPIAMILPTLIRFLARQA